MASAAGILQLRLQGLTTASGPHGQAIAIFSLQDMLSVGINTGQTVGIRCCSDTGSVHNLVDIYASEMALKLQHDDIGDNGRHTLILAAWPSPGAGKGTVQLGTEMWETLGRPALGSLLQVVSIPFTGKVCARLFLRLVMNADTQRPACLPAAGRAAAAVSADKEPSTPVKSARKGSRTPSKDTTPSSRTPASQKATPAGRAAATPGSSNTASRDQQADTPAAEQQSKPPTELSRTSLEWLLQTIARSDESDPQRHLLNTLAAQHLHNRRLLRGNLALIPLLGRRVIVQVLGMEDSELDDDCLCIVSAESTRVALLGPGVAPAGGGGGAGAQPGVEGEDSVSQRASRADGADVKVLVAQARAAAEAAVPSGDSAAAAATAAERAVLSGAAAAGVTYAQLGGVDDLRAAMRELVTYPLRCPQLFAAYALKPPRGVLLHGPPGSGKTVLARAAAAEAGVLLLVVDGAELLSEHPGESEAAVRGVFAAARALAPALVFLDEVDALAPARDGMAARGRSGQASEVAGRVLTTLLTEIEGLSSDGSGQQVVVLAATNRRDSVDMALRRPGRFDREVEVTVPSPAARLAMLQRGLERMPHSLSPAQIAATSASLHGYVAADIALLCNEAAMAVLRRWVAVREGGGETLRVAALAAQSEGHASCSQELVVGMEDIRVARTRVRPSAMREVMLEVPQVAWDDVGGLDSVKQQLKEAVEWPQERGEVLEALNARPPTGVLLYGPPGCSKTMLAKAVASSSGLNFIAVKGAELYSQYVGESEKAVARLFARARIAAPCIVFFDEIDGLVSARALGGDASAGTNERVLSQILSEMDGLQRRQGVVVIAATNRPDKLDAALLRPGRFDRLVYVPPPDAASRGAILRVLLRKTPLADDVDVTQLAQQCDGYTGADLLGLCRAAAMAALEEDIGAPCVCLRHFQQALPQCRASPPPSTELVAVYKAMQRQGTAMPAIL